MIKKLFGKLVLTGTLLSLCFGAHAQSFSVDTAVVQTADRYSYAFTLNYDQMGAAQSLTDGIWDWTFNVDPSLPTPTDITTPTGWKSSFDTSSGQFDFYTEGPSGFGSGDFGAYVIQPGQILHGFGLTTAAAPDLSIAFAMDEQFNQDATLATLPATVPAAVPEVSTCQGLGLLLLLGGMFAFRRLSTKTV